MKDEPLLQSISEMMDKKLEPINNRLDGMEGRMDRLEFQVSALRVTQLEQGREMKEINSRVTDTYHLALEDWGLGTENRRWLELAKE